MALVDQLAKAKTFKALHERQRAFPIANPWDRGSTRLLEHMGFEALATTSLGLANMLGRRRATLKEILDNTRLICESTHLPVNADAFLVDLPAGLEPASGNAVFICHDMSLSLYEG